MAHAGGRPTIYSKKLSDKICHELSKGASLRTVCQMDGMPEGGTIFRWLAEKTEFREQYAQAKQESADALNEVLLDLGDDAIRLSQEVDSKASGAVVQAVKLKADNMKWYMSKMKPKKYGDKTDVTTNGKDFPAPVINVIKYGESNNTAI